MVYAPLEMYFYNLDDFWFDFSMLLPVCLMLFFALWVVGSLVFIILDRINKHIYSIGIIGGFVAQICSYMQGTFLINRLPPMDGTDIDWKKYSVENTVTIILWIIVLVSCLILIRFVKKDFFIKIAGGGSFFLFLILLVSIIFSGFMTSGYKSKDLLVATNKFEFEYSEDTNFIIFVLDAVDAGTMSRVLEADEESRAAFTDFTYYENVLCAYPFTKYSMPFILSGKWYTNDEPPLDYFRKSIKESTFINAIKDQYKMEIYSDSIPVVNERNTEQFDNMVLNCCYVSSYEQFVKGVVKLAGIRYAPYPLKGRCYNVLEQFDGARGIELAADEDQIYTWNNKELYQRIGEKDISYTGEKVFKLIHTQGAHVPYQYNKKVEKIENGTYLGNVEASITIAAGYLNKLKENNVYDNSVIIIMADHGYSTEGLIGRQNPILFIKGIGEHHDMKTSNAPISYADLQDAYQLLLAGKSGEQVFDWEEGQVRQRKYLLYKYEEEEKMYEYVTEGDAADTEAMEATGREFVR